MDNYLWSFTVFIHMAKTVAVKDAQSLPSYVLGIYLEVKESERFWLKWCLKTYWYGLRMLGALDKAKSRNRFVRK